MIDSFDEPPEYRSDDSTPSSSKPLKKMLVYPFRIHHATGEMYTLYSNSDVERLRWKRALEDVISPKKGKAGHKNKARFKFLCLRSN